MAGAGAGDSPRRSQARPMSEAPAPPSALPDSPLRPRHIVSFPLKVLSVAIGLLVLVMVAGVVMGGKWRVERAVSVAAPPATVFTWIDDPRRWDEWAPLGEVKTTFSGPERGVGATRSWDDPNFGDGVFRIVETTPDQAVRYHVEVQKGALVTDGVIELAPEGAGTRVTWREAGDFGHNPLMGYTARSMDRMQGPQMENSLKRLAEKIAATR
jgi:carbon monoxide dehydrogenase subunit G